MRTFDKGDRVRLAKADANGSRDGVVVLVSGGFPDGRPRYAVRWDDAVAVPGYLAEELEARR
jgi:hypothetical protein